MSAPVSRSVNVGNCLINIATRCHRALLPQDLPVNSPLCGFRGGSKLGSDLSGMLGAIDTANFIDGQTFQAAAEKLSDGSDAMPANSRLRLQRTIEHSREETLCCAMCA